MRFAYKKANKALEVMKTKIFLATIILLTALSTLAAPSEEGKTIFAARCAVCHNVNKILVGPALAGVNERRSIDWIVKFVHSPQTIIKSGDPYAVALLTKFKIQMPEHPDLTEDNIKSVVEYIKAEATNNKALGETQTTKTDKMQTNYLNLILTSPGLLVTSLALIAILIAALAFVIKVKQMQRSKTS